MRAGRSTVFIYSRARTVLGDYGLFSFLNILRGLFFFFFFLGILFYVLVGINLRRDSVHITSKVQFSSQWLQIDNTKGIEKFTSFQKGRGGGYLL